MKKQSILNLIKYYSDKNDLAFKNEAYEIARDFLQSGDREIAQYIIMLLSNGNSFSAQDKLEEYSFFKKVPLSAQPVYLPDSIKRNIDGVVNAIKKRNGINKFLFEGKPGTGKTETVKLLAASLKKTLYCVDFNQVIDSKLGQTGKNLSELFETMNRISMNNNQYMFLFDEIDILAFDRLNTSDIREMGRVTSLFLKELDELNENVIFFATTNLFKKFDKALTRRFDAIVNFDSYSIDDLCEIAGLLLSEYKDKYGIYNNEPKIINKLLKNTKNEITPGELRNIIKISLAFANPDNQYEYLKRIYGYLYDNETLNDLTFLSNLGLTLREIEILTGESKSSIARKLKGDIDE